MHGSLVWFQVSSQWSLGPDQWADDYATDCWWVHSLSHCSVFPQQEWGFKMSHFFVTGWLLCASVGEKSGQIHYLSMSSGKRWKSWAFMSRESCSSTLGALTWHFIVSLVHWDVEGAFSDWTLRPTGLSGDVRHTKCIASVASALAACSITVDTCPSVLIVVRLTFWVNVQLQGSSLNSVAAGEPHGQLVGLD
jgi:hypothetical protein